MFLKNISAVQFKSHHETRISLSPGIHCITGKNGTGKTNLLDAVFTLLNARSYFQTSDSLCVEQGMPYYMLSGTMEHACDLNELKVSFFPGKGKSILINGERVNRLSEYFGRFPCVVIAPNDVDILTGESDNRRRFFDYLYSVTVPDYMDHLVAYNRYLDQRNRQLKHFAETGTFDPLLLEAYEIGMEKHGTFIHSVRSEKQPLFQTYYENACLDLTNREEVAKMHYRSSLNDHPFRQGFEKNLGRDRALCRTGFGIHKDDWDIELHDMPLRKTGSQGQIKTSLIALKLAMYTFIREVKQQTPLLLLDDIFEKIDQHRMKGLVRMISQDHTGQVLITDTSKDRLGSYLEGLPDIRFTEL